MPGMETVFIPIGVWAKLRGMDISMKIELWYDAVAQETDILINEVPVEKNDVYGFLYPVRNYPIQSWIYPNGSWKGLEYQVVDLARDEDVELTFHGRKCDYNDLMECLSQNKAITLRFVEWDICRRYDKLFSKLLSIMQSNDSVMRKLLSSLNIKTGYKVNFNVSANKVKWACSIYDDSDLAKADELSDKCCCYIHSSFFTSYEKLQDLLSLTRSLKIPADAIYCCFKDKQTKEDYEYYAHSFKRMNFKFYLEDSDYAKEAESKYGLPSTVKWKIERCEKLLKSLCEAYLKLKEKTQDEFNILKKKIVNLNQQEKKRYQEIKRLRDNADRFRYGMEIIYKYIDNLLSVSKDNKEEILHYKCIDKLDENINLYLNEKSFNGVC